METIKKKKEELTVRDKLVKLCEKQCSKYSSCNVLNIVAAMF